MTFELDNWRAAWFILTLSGPGSKVKVIDKSSKPQEKNEELWKFAPKPPFLGCFDGSPCDRAIVRGYVLGRPVVKRFVLCYQTVVLSVCLWRWCIVAKRLDGSRWNLAWM